MNTALKDSLVHPVLTFGSTDSSSIANSLSRMHDFPLIECSCFLFLLSIAYHYIKSYFSIMPEVVSTNDAVRSSETIPTASPVCTRHRMLQNLAALVSGLVVAMEYDWFFYFVSNQLYSIAI